MYIDKNKNSRISKSPLKLNKPLSDREASLISNEAHNKLVSSGRLKKNGSNKSIDSETSFGLQPICDKCDKCNSMRENVAKALGHVKTYVDTINERLNTVYHKISSSKKVGPESDPSLSPEYIHTIFYSNLDKMKISREITTQFRSLMKSVRFFNDKFDYIIKKHENFEILAQEYRKILFSNKLEEASGIPETDMNEIKSLEIQNIFKNFNNAKESFENNFKEIKNMVNGSYERTHNNTTELKSLESLYVDYSDNKLEGKDSYLRNELARMSKENISLKLEMNYIYEKLKEENKIFEIKEDKVLNKTISKENMLSNQNINNIFSPNFKNSQKSVKSYNSSSASASNHNTNANPIIVFQVKNDKINEEFLIAKNYIKVLKQSEFLMV